MKGCSSSHGSGCVNLPAFLQLPWCTDALTIFAVLGIFEGTQGLGASGPGHMFYDDGPWACAFNCACTHLIIGAQLYVNSHALPDVQVRDALQQPPHLPRILQFVCLCAQRPHRRPLHISICTLPFTQPYLADKGNAAVVVATLHQRELSWGSDTLCYQRPPTVNACHAPTLLLL